MSVTLEDLKACSGYELGERPGRGGKLKYYFSHPDPDHLGYIVNSAQLVAMLNYGVTSNGLYQRGLRGVTLDELLFSDNLGSKKVGLLDEALIEKVKRYLDEHHFMNIGDFRKVTGGQDKLWKRVNVHMEKIDKYACFVLRQPQKTAYLCLDNPESIRRMIDYSVEVGQQNNRAHKSDVRLKLNGEPAKKTGPKTTKAVKVAVMPEKAKLYGMECRRVDKLANYNSRMGAVWSWFGVSA